MKLRLSSLLLLFMTAAFMSGQQAPLTFTVDTPTTPQLLTQWLQSGDFRLMAWAAYFAQRDHDASVLAFVAEKLEHWPEPLMNAGRFGTRQRSAAEVLLDALIRSDVEVQASTIDAISQSFPVQALILIRRLPPDRSVLTLKRWSASGAEPLKRVASMYLTERREPAFISEILQESELHLHVTVLPEGVGMGFGSSSSCGSPVGLVLDGWPPLYSYGLVEGNSGDAVLIDLGEDRMMYRRIEMSQGGGSCNSVMPLNHITRARLLAYWLGVSYKGMAWQPEERETIYWQNNAQYEHDLGALIAAKEKLLRKTALELENRGLIPAGRAHASVPKLVLQVTCEIHPCPLP